MRRLVSLATLAGFLAVPAPSMAASELRWIAYVRAPQIFTAGSLHLVRSDGRERSVAVDSGVFSADLGVDGSVFGVLQDAEGPFEGSSRLVRVPREGAPETLLEQEGTTYLNVAAGPEGEVATLRYVPWRPRAPQFLRPALRRLGRTEVPVLTPPSRPDAPVRLSTVASARRESYELLFTNDPERQMAHAEQFNRFVTGTQGPSGAPPETPVEVRGTTGNFHCGASACFVDWEEDAVTYSVGEFGAPEEAVAFADSLVPIEELVGDFWRLPEVQAPQLVVVGPNGREDLIESVDGFCECGFHPVAWGPDDDRLLVIQSAELFTTLVEYPSFGGEPDRLMEGDEGEIIYDAGYGPDGVMVLVGGEGGPPGTLRWLDGGTVVDDVRAFDVQGTTLAYVTANGDVMVRSLPDGGEQRVGRGAVDVSVGPDVIVEAQPTPSPSVGPGAEQGLPGALIAFLALGAMALLLGAYLLWRSARRR